MIYTFLMKNKPMKIVPDSSKLPSNFFVPYFYSGLLTKYGNFIKDDIINFIIEKSNTDELSLHWKNKTLSSVSLNKDDLINPQMNKGILTFELKREKYSQLRDYNRHLNRSSLGYYDLNSYSKETETFEIDVANLLAKTLQTENLKIGVHYNKNHFFETKKEDPNSQYIFLEIPMFNKKYGIEAYHNNVYQDEETSFVATAFAVLGSVKNQSSPKIDFLYADHPSRKYEHYREISADNIVSVDYVGLFKYNDQYLKIQSSNLYNNGTIFTIDTEKNSYGFLNDDSMKYITGMELLNYIRHNIAKSYSVYECVGVGSQKQIGFPRAYQQIQNLSHFSEENLYLIPAPVYSHGTYAVDEKTYDNSELMYPDDFLSICGYTRPEEIMKYHHNRSFFFIESGFDIHNDSKELLSNHNYRTPYIDLDKNNQLILHYGKSDWLTIEGKKKAYFRKLPFKLESLEQAKTHARNAYNKLNETKTVSPWKIDTFDKFRKNSDLIESWQDNFTSPNNYKNFINDFLDLAELKDKGELFLVPLEKDKEISEESTIEHALYHIDSGFAWYCKIDEVIESDIESISMPICEVLHKISKYGDYDFNKEKGIVYGVTESSNYRHSIKYPIFSVMNREDLENLRLEIYKKWIAPSKNRNDI